VVIIVLAKVFSLQPRRTSSKVPLKVPKREIFVTELSTLSDPIWVGDLRNEPKNPFDVNCWVDIPRFAFLAMTEYAVKIIPRLLSMR
jgi:hypothetical protein